MGRTISLSHNKLNRFDLNIDLLLFLRHYPWDPSHPFLDSTLRSMRYCVFSGQSDLYMLMYVGIDILYVLLCGYAICRLSNSLSLILVFFCPCNLWSNIQCCVLLTKNMTMTARLKYWRTLIQLPHSVLKILLSQILSISPPPHTQSHSNV